MPKTREKQYDEINAMPTKRLFIDTLTRDVSVKDCIFDLIDNSVDAYIRNQIKGSREVRLDICKDAFTIVDDCGGIDYDLLISQVFRFGVDVLQKNVPTLGVYGIGLKRAMLKLGKIIDMEIDNGTQYCEIHLDVDDWLGHDKWTIPFETVTDSQLSKNGNAYTKIRISEIHEAVQQKFELDSFINDIEDFIHITYTYFMPNQIKFFLNDVLIKPFVIKVRYDENYQPIKVTNTFDGVKVEVICFIDPSEGRMKKERGRQGWNVFCNKRLILVDDVSKITGWTGDKDKLPKFHYIYNEFRGIVFIHSNDPSKLPINTAKNGLDTEAKIYSSILNIMIRTARPVIDYLSKKYDKERKTLAEIDEKIMKDEGISGAKQEGTLIELSELRKKSEFKAPFTKVKRIKMANISYRKPGKMVEKVKKHLKAKTNKEVGELTFNYYVELEDITND